MTTLPPPRPLLPVAQRMLLGLMLAAAGGLLAWSQITLKPTPGLETTLTPLEIPLDGPLPFNYAQSATLNFEGDRASLLLSPLPASSALLLSGEARHRTRNPVNFRLSRPGKTVTATAKLYVKPLSSERVPTPSPEPYQHSLRAALTPAIPLTLSTSTVGGNQTVNLAGLRVRSFAARSDSGRIDLALPARPGGPYAVVTRSGRVEITVPEGASPEALRVNSQSGNLTVNTGGAVLDALNAGSLSGNINLTLPARVNRGSITTASGNVNLTVPAGARGNLDIRTYSGNVNLTVPPNLRVRVRFTNRETLLLPPGTPVESAPQLDIFVDTSSGNFNLQN